MTTYPKKAIIVMMIIILCSSTISAVSKINSLASGVSNTTGYGAKLVDLINEDIEDKTGDAYKLKQLAAKYLGTDDKSVTTLQDCIDSLEDETSLSKQYDLIEEMDEAFNDILTRLATKSLTDSEKETLDELRMDYASETKTLSTTGDSYNDAVDAFHKEVDGIPGSLFEILAKKVSYYR